MKTTQDRLYHLISSQLKIEISKISNTTDIIADLGADSLDAVELAIKIEDTFNIKFEDNEIEKFSKIEDILNFIQSKGI
jgi:acyl carrier protein